MFERDGLAHELRALGGRAAEASAFEIIGSDTRSRVADATVAPYRWVCFIELKSPDPSRPRRTKLTRGTGTLISPMHVLTSAHLFDTLLQGGMGTLTVWPGRNGSATPFGSAKVKRWSIAEGYARRRSASYDYAILALDTKVDGRTSKGQRLGYWGADAHSSVARRSVAAVRGRDVEVAGYPGVSPDGTDNGMWRAVGSASIDDKRRPRVVSHTASTTLGMSGAPVWITEAAGPTLVGVHHGGGAISIDAITGAQTYSNNDATRITAESHARIMRWLAQK